MLLNIRHRTHYRFENPVPYGLQRLRLIPKENASQKIKRWDMKIEGGTTEADYTDGEVETSDTAGVIGRHGGHIPLWYFLKSTPLTEASREIQALARSVGDVRSDPLVALHKLSAQVLSAVRYETGRTDSTTTAEMALEAGHGVCQDHAHIFISAARHLGIPARYVSGYLMLTDRIEQEASHAWAEAHIDGLGWVGFDISNGISPDPRYVRVATGSDYAEAAPISGVSYGSGEQSMVVSLAVEQ
jgi:transglutaminase-like putative cysteine protease